MTVADFSAIIAQTLPEPHAGLLSGIVFGTKATLSKSLVDSLIKTGTLHIVALSGMNITIMASLINLTLLRVISRRISSLLTVLIVIGFVWFVGPAPSIIRAAIMGIIALLSVILGKPYWAVWSYILAVSIMLVLNPLWINDLSFQLSALATLGIILFGGKTTKKKPVNFISILLSSIGDDLHVTLAAQVFTIPLILVTFYRISLVSPLSNVLIGWTIAPLTVMGWLVAALGWLWLPLGQIVAWISWVFLEYVIRVITITGTIPGASIGW